MPQRRCIVNMGVSNPIDERADDGWDRCTLFARRRFRMQTMLPIKTLELLKEGKSPIENNSGRAA